jgi:hypothetical protein
MRKSLVGLALAAIALAGPAFAHHSANAQFDMAKNYTLKGVLLKYEIINPHPYMHFRMAGPDGAQADWALETVTPAALRRLGLPAREAFKPGQTYTFIMSPARNGSKVGFMHSITLLDGRTVALSAEDNLRSAK